MGEGYAADLRDKIEKGSSVFTYLNSYDFIILKQKLGYIQGIEKIEDPGYTDNDYRIELLGDPTLRVGQHFETRILVDNSVSAGVPRFSNAYSSEEILIYQLPDLAEEGALLSEEGELLVCL